MTDVLVLKSTLLYSNPQIVRVFRIDSRATVAMLIQTISMLHGWKTPGQLRLMLKSDNEHTIADEVDGVIRTSISEAMLLDKIDFTDAIVRMPMNPPDNNYNSTYYRSYETAVQGYWVFRLELVGKETIDIGKNDSENSDEESETDGQLFSPELIRFRSYHPYPGCSSMKACNKYLLELERNGRIYDYGMHDLAEFTVDMAAINSRLSKLTGSKNKGLSEYRVNMNRGISLYEILNRHTVAEMRKVVKDNLFDIPSNLLKNELIYELTCEYDTHEFWYDILRYMSFKEYMNFKAYVSVNQDKEFEKRFYPIVLNEYCLTYNDNIGKVMYVPKEFLEYYEQMMTEDGDEELLSRKMVDAAVKVCSRLYGLFDRSACFRLYSCMYPQEKNEEVFSDIWNEYIEKSSISVFEDYYQSSKRLYAYGSVDSKYLFNIKNLTRDQAEKLIKDKTYRSIDYYLPEGEYAENILENGLDIRKEYYNEIIKQFKKLKFNYYRVKNYDTPALLLLAFLHAGISGEEAVKKISNEYFRQEKQVIIEGIVNTVNEVRKHVRIIQLKGHTINELGENLVINRQTY